MTSHTTTVKEFKRSSDFKTKINVVITHGSCPDGFMSATIVRRWLVENKIDIDNVVFINAYHGTNYDYLIEEVIDKYVLICDFSFNKTLFANLITATSGNIFLIDHHKTAKKELDEVDCTGVDRSGIESKYVLFDMNHSGAYLTWAYFYGTGHIPNAVLYIEDHDLFNHVLPNTREFTAFVSTLSYEFNEYDKLFDEDYLQKTVMPLGTGMVMINEKNIETISNKSMVYLIQIHRRFYFVACVNSAGILVSEIGNKVLNKHPNANFSIVYTQNDYNNSTRMSLRSSDEKTDTSVIAKIYEGGGHRNASGCMIYQLIKHPGKCVDSYHSYRMLDNLYVMESGKTKMIVLNTPTHATELSAYLMQERYVGDEKNRNKLRYDNNLPGYQEAMFCMRNKTSNQTLDEHYDGSIVWHFDGEKNIAVCKFLRNIAKKLSDDTNIVVRTAREFTYIQTQYSIEKLVSLCS